LDNLICCPHAVVIVANNIAIAVFILGYLL
jgi:hypothetical protein